MKSPSSRARFAGLFQNTRKKLAIVVSGTLVLLTILALIAYKYFFTASSQKVWTGEISQEQMNSSDEPDEPGVSESLMATASEEELAEETATQQNTAEVIILDTPTGWLSVRDGPGKTFERIGKILPQETHQLLEEDEGWFKIDISSEETDEEITGWMFSEYAAKN